MAVPLAYLAAGLAAIIVEIGKEVVKERLLKEWEHQKAKYEDTAIAMAFERAGLPWVEGTPVNERTLLESINAGPLAGTGLVLEGLFDKDALRRFMVQLAWREAGSRFGFSATSVEGLKEEMKIWLGAQLEEQIMSGAGEFVNVAPDIQRIVQLINQRPPDYASQQARDFSKEGINNRERQRAYRASHSRVWRAKP